MERTAESRGKSPVEASTMPTLYSIFRPFRRIVAAKELSWLMLLTANKRPHWIGMYTSYCIVIKFAITSIALIIVNIFRPIAGHANLCPDSISTKPQELETLVSTVKHEMLHALVSAVLYHRFSEMLLIVC